MKNKVIKVVVGSRNPVKINAVRTALTTLLVGQQTELSLECLGIDAPSNVSDQPMTADETRLGAINRVNYCQQHHQADYYVAIEGGIENFSDGPANFAYVVIADKLKQSIGRSAILPLPPVVYQALVAGEELGHVMDRLFNTKNIKQKGGAIGQLTQGAATRESAYTEALLLAMAPFVYPELYSD